MFQMRLAGRDFMIENRFDYIENLCRDYVSQGGEARRVCPALDGAYAESLAVHRLVCETLIPMNVLPFHASALALDGAAYLFTAPSGTGKSTHARLWRERFGPRAVMINDDKPLLSFENGVCAWGSPWCGKEGLQTNTSAPVRGIIVLRQARENSIRRLTAREAFPLLYRQTWQPDDLRLTMQAMDMTRRLCELPVFLLECTISQAAVQMAYRALTGREINP